MFLFIIYTYIVYFIILYTCICVYLYIYTTIIVLFTPTIWNVDPFEANVGQLRDRKKSNRRGRPLFPYGGYLVGQSLDWLKGKTPGIIQETSEKQGFYHIINCINHTNAISFLFRDEEGEWFSSINTMHRNFRNQSTSGIWFCGVKHFLRNQLDG